jgi:hypothetical protein
MLSWEYERRLVNKRRGDFDVDRYPVQKGPANLDGDTGYSLHFAVYTH